MRYETHTFAGSAGARTAEMRHGTAPFPLPELVDDLPGETSVATLLEQALTSVDTDLATTRACVARVTALLEKQEDAAPATATRRRVGAGLAPWQARRVSTHVDENLGFSITIDHLASIAGLSSSYFCRAFKDTFGDPPHAYIMRRRVERAQALMLQTREPLSQIALACGLSDQAHLCNLFRRLVGQSPSHWRRARWQEA